MSATDFSARRYMKLFVYWPVPCIRHVARRSSSGTASAIPRRPWSIRAVFVYRRRRHLARRLEMNRSFTRAQRAPLSDPRVHVHIEDGRYFSRRRDDRFDLITGEPPPYDLAGVSNLYSREYFQLLREHLAEGGVVTYWLHVRRTAPSAAFKSILRAFCDAFEDCSLWHASDTDFMMVGTHGDVTAPPRKPSSPVADPENHGRDARARPRAPRAARRALHRRRTVLAGAHAGVDAVDDDHPHRLTPSPGGGTGGLAGRRVLRRKCGARALPREPARGADWPASLRERSARFFEHQALLNELLNHTPGRPPGQELPSPRRGFGRLRSPPPGAAPLGQRSGRAARALRAPARVSRTMPTSCGIARSESSRTATPRRGGASAHARQFTVLRYGREVVESRGQRAQAMDVRRAIPRRLPPRTEVAFAVAGASLRGAGGAVGVGAPGMPGNCGKPGITGMGMGRETGRHGKRGGQRGTGAVRKNGGKPGWATSTPEAQRLRLSRPAVSRDPAKGAAWAAERSAPEKA